jgi:hypothetical protein
MASCFACHVSYAMKLYMTTLRHPAFRALRPLHSHCRISIVIPVRNEQQRLEHCLSALYHQRTSCGTPVERERYEVLLLLNNCTDASAHIAQQFAGNHPDLHLHVIEHTFEKRHAHVGNARSLLMQQAAFRLRSAPDARARAHRLFLLTTDADTTVDPCWLAETIEAFNRGADAVGGDILVPSAERLCLARQARLAYALDRRYLHAVCLLETLLDPLPHDPWPRHHHHFGASLACTLHAFDVCGGMEPTPMLEDLAFYRALVAAGMRFRHEPRVRVYTSARTQGRAPIGLSEQLRQWHRTTEIRVPSSAFHERRCVAMATLRSAMQGKGSWQHVSRLFRMASDDLRSTAMMLGTSESAWHAVNGDARIRNGLHTEAQDGTLHAELGNLHKLIRQLKPTCAIHQAGKTDDTATQPGPTMAAAATYRARHLLPVGNPLLQASSAPAADPLLPVGVAQ